MDIHKKVAVSGEGPILDDRGTIVRQIDGPPLTLLELANRLDRALKQRAALDETIANMRRLIDEASKP